MKDDLLEEIKKLKCLLAERDEKAAQRGHAEEIFSRFVKDTFLMPSEEFIHVLVSHLASVLEFHYCLISEVASPAITKARTLAVYANGDFVDNFEYDLAETPCQKVFHNQALCYYPRDVQKLFPRDHFLKSMDIESYVGIPIFTSPENMRGILVAMNDKAIVHEVRTKSVMEIFSIRAALELDRRQKEDELRKFKYAVDQSPSIVAITDDEGKIEYVNPFFTETTGYTFQEVFGKKPNILKSGVHPPAFYQELWQCITSGKVWRNPLCNRKKSGDIYWESASISAIIDSKGSIVNFIKIAEDITERKKIEEDLQRSKANLAEAQRISHLGNWNWDIIKNEINWSDEVYRIFGLKPQEFDATYESFLKFIHTDDREFVNKSVTESLNNRTPYIIDFRIIRTDGTECIVNAQGEVTYDQSGKAIGMVGTVLDITERKQIEEKIRESEHRYRAISELATDYIYEISVETNGQMSVKWISDGFTQLTGYIVDDVKYPDRWGKIIFADDLPCLMQLFQAILAGQPSKKDIRIITKSGEMRWINIYGRPEWDSQHNCIVAILGAASDVTKQKSMEEELKSLSLTDELTGLYNRRGLLTLTDHLFKMARRENRGLFMLYGDLDNLKEINDKLGHEYGDSAIIDFADILKTNYRESDIITRLGGDEFVVIPVGYAGDNITAITERLQKRLDDYNENHNRRYKLSVSVGIVYYDPAFPCTIDELLKRGDKLMYEQKKLKKKSSFQTV